MESMAELKKSKEARKPTKLTTFFNEHPVIKYLFDFCFLVIVYGFLINFSLHIFFLSFKISVMNLFGCGIAFYFIKEEMPRIIQRCMILRNK